MLKNFGQKMQGILCPCQRKRIFVLVVLITMGIHAYAYALYQKPDPELPLPVMEDTKISAPALPEEFDLPGFLASHNIQSVEDYALWVKENLEYKADQNGDAWAAPLDTLRKRAGDCEDLAFLHQLVLKHFGYASRVWANGKSKEAHVFCLFKKDGVFHVFDNTNYHNLGTGSIKTVVMHLLLKKSQFLLELKQDPKSISVVYKAPSFKG